MAQKELKVIDVKAIDSTVKELRNIDPREMTVLIPNIALEFAVPISKLYHLGVRKIYIYSLDEGLKFDFEQKIHQKCPDLEMNYFDLEDEKETLPKFTFTLKIPAFAFIDEKIRLYIAKHKIPTISVNDLKN